MTLRDLDEIKARCEAATLGPWKHSMFVDSHRYDRMSDEWKQNADRMERELVVRGPGTIGTPGCNVVLKFDHVLPGDMAFIIHARQDVPNLLTEATCLQAQLEVAHGSIGQLEAEIERLCTQLQECDAERRELRGRLLVNATSDLFDMCEPGTPEEIDEILREAGHDPDDVGRKMAQTAREALKRLVPDIEDSKR